MDTQFFTLWCGGNSVSLINDCSLHVVIQALYWFMIYSTFTSSLSQPLIYVIIVITVFNILLE